MMNLSFKNLFPALSQTPKRAFLLGAFVLIAASNAFAQNNSLTLRTYLAPPSLAFDRIRLLSTPEPETCKTGEFLMNESSKVLFCNAGVWGPFSSIWNKNGDFITLLDTDLLNQKIGIGTSSPQLKLSLQNDGGILAKDTLAVGDGSYSDTPGIKNLSALVWSPKQSTFRAGRVEDPVEWRISPSPATISSYSTVFGFNNSTGSAAQYSSIIGGESNTISSVQFSTIMGGFNNKLTLYVGTNQAILGGSGNEISSNYPNGLIGGGEQNMIVESANSAIGGGRSNNISDATSFNSAIIGGSENLIKSTPSSLIGGGQNNSLNSQALYKADEGGTSTQSPVYASIIGGYKNILLGSPYSFIGGGSENEIVALHYNTIYGGQGNQIKYINGSAAKDIYSSAIGGGAFNKIYSSSSFIGGGMENKAGTGPANHGANGYATVIGGQNNNAAGKYSFVGGGQNNTASGESSSVAGGSGNTASGNYSFVGGGASNTASGTYSAVLGGEGNTARGSHSFAGGRNMTASGNNTFIWGHSATPQTASKDNTFIIATGNVGIGTISPTDKLHVNGDVRIDSTTATPYSLILNSVNVLSSSAQNLKINTTTGVIGFDIAETFASAEEVSSGDVLVMDPAEPGRVKVSTAAYDPHVIGIASKGPAVTLKGNQLHFAADTVSFERGTTPPVALKGRVAVKVSLENGPILPGDALTTSSLSGHAMRATDAARSTGAIIGKALEKFDGNNGSSQTGVITAFVALY